MIKRLSGFWVWLLPPLAGSSSLLVSRSALSSLLLVASHARLAFKASASLDGVTKQHNTSAALGRTTFDFGVWSLHDVHTIISHTPVTGLRWHGDPLSPAATGYTREGRARDEGETGSRPADRPHVACAASRVSVIYRFEIVSRSRASAAVTRRAGRRSSRGSPRSHHAHHALPLRSRLSSELFPDASWHTPP